MFETAVVQFQPHNSRSTSLLISSLVFHVGAAVLALALTITSITFPRDAPHQMAAYLSTPVVQLPAASHPPVAQHVETRPAPATPARSATPVFQPTAVTTPSPQTAPAPDASASSSIGSDATGPVIGIVGSNTGPIGVGPATGPATGEDVGPETGPLVPGGDVRAPVVIQRIEPVYPPIAIRSRMPGRVRVSCIIDRAGHVTSAQVVESSSRMFEQPAIDAVKRWKFVAGSLNGRPVETLFELTVTFAIR